jgi:hypothetical protein
MKTIDAQNLDVDLRNGCTISSYTNGAPRMVYPSPGGAIPRTRGQVSEATVHELMISRIVRAFIHRCNG